MQAYSLISADSHINEPPNLWLDRVPKKFRDRAPRMERMDKGDAWIIEGSYGPVNFGHNTNNGVPADQRPSWVRWEEVRPGGYDPAARIREMDQDGVDAELMYPTPRVCNSIFWNNVDQEFHLALIRAYNDWLSEYCSHDPERLGGAAMMPTGSLEAAMGEYRRVSKLPGIKAAMLGQWPAGGVTVSPEDDPFFAEVAGSDLPLSIHVSFVSGAQGDHRGPRVTGEFRFFDVPIRARELINGGALDRFPELKVAFVEVDCGWVPYVKEQMDDRFKRADPNERPKIKLPPSRYFERNFFYVFITDTFGIANRHLVGVDRMLWSTDYPHTGADWPHSQQTVERHFTGVPQEERQQILAGNAARLYRFGTS